MNSRGQIVDENEKKLGPAELRASKLSKLAETNKLLYKETEQNLSYESSDILRCWKEFTEKSLSDLETESKMWLDIMNRGKLNPNAMIEASTIEREEENPSRVVTFKLDVL